MTGRKKSAMKVLSLYPTRDGFSYSFFESSTQLIRWGNCTKGKTGTAIKFQSLIEEFNPELVVTEHHEHQNFKRGKRIAKALKEIYEITERNNIYIQKYSRFTIKGVFSCFEISNKYGMAGFLANVFPEVSGKMPPKPKIWKSEHYRMGLFDSLAFAFTYYYIEGNLNSK